MQKKKERIFLLIRFWDHTVGSDAGLGLCEALGEYRPDLSNKHQLVLGSFISVNDDGTIDRSDDKNWEFTSILRSAIVSKRRLRYA